MRQTSVDLCRRPDQGRAQSAGQGERRGESAKAAKKAADKPAAKPAKSRCQGAGQERRRRAVRIDFDGLDHRIVALPVPAGSYRNLPAGEAGQIFYPKVDPPPTPAAAAGRLLDPQVRFQDPQGRGRSDRRFDGFVLIGRQEEDLSIAARVADHHPGRAQAPAGPGRLERRRRSRSGSIPAAEWRQIFDEAWRINRDYFYAPNMHGADWPAMKTKYEVFLPHLACRGDLNRVIQWMCSELGVGHHRVGGGDSPAETRTRRRAACSAPITPSRTAATGSRRSTAA